MTKRKGVRKFPNLNDVINECPQVAWLRQKSWAFTGKGKATGMFSSLVFKTCFLGPQGSWLPFISVAGSPFGKFQPMMKILFKERFLDKFFTVRWSLPFCYAISSRDWLGSIHKWRHASRAIGRVSNFVMQGIKV